MKNVVFRSVLTVPARFSATVLAVNTTFRLTLMSNSPILSIGMAQYGFTIPSAPMPSAGAIAAADDWVLDMCEYLTCSLSGRPGSVT